MNSSIEYSKEHGLLHTELLTKIKKLVQRIPSHRSTFVKGTYFDKNNREHLCFYFDKNAVVLLDDMRRDARAFFKKKGFNYYYGGV